MEYLLSLIIIFIIFLVIKQAYKIKIFNSWKQWAYSYIVIFAVGIVWDTAAIARGWWSFGDKYIIGIKIGLMPLEEYLFILIVPFGGMVLYKLMLRIK